MRGTHHQKKWFMPGLSTGALLYLGLFFIAFGDQSHARFFSHYLIPQAQKKPPVKTKAKPRPVAKTAESKAPSKTKPRPVAKKAESKAPSKAKQRPVAKTPKRKAPSEPVALGKSYPTLFYQSDQKQFLEGITDASGATTFQPLSVKEGKLEGNLQTRTADDFFRYCDDNKFNKRLDLSPCTKPFLEFHQPKAITKNVDENLHGLIFSVRKEFMLIKRDGFGNPVYQPIYLGGANRPLNVKTGPNRFERITDPDVIRAIVQAYQKSNYPNKKIQSVVNRLLSFYDKNGRRISRRRL